VGSRILKKRWQVAEDNLRSLYENNGRDGDPLKGTDLTNETAVLKETTTQEQFKNANAAFHTAVLALSQYNAVLKVAPTIEIPSDPSNAQLYLSDAQKVAESLLDDQGNPKPGVDPAAAKMAQQTFGNGI